MLCAFLLSVLFITNIGCDSGLRGINTLTTADLECCGWQMVFRGTSGNGDSVHDAWTTGSGTTQVKPKSMKRSYDLHYRDASVSQWSNLRIQLVKFAFYDTDREVAYVIFDGRGSTVTNWFAKERVIYSSYGDLTSNNFFNVFSIDGTVMTGLYDRRFLINRESKQCTLDRTHLVVINSNVSTPNCQYDFQPLYPAFIYSRFNSVDFLERRMFGAASYLAIFVKQRD